MAKFRPFTRSRAQLAQREEESEAAKSAPTKFTVVLDTVATENPEADDNPIGDVVVVNTDPRITAADDDDTDQLSVDDTMAPESQDNPTGTGTRVASRNEIVAQLVVLITKREKSEKLRYRHPHSTSVSKIGDFPTPTATNANTKRPIEYKLLRLRGGPDELHFGLKLPTPDQPLTVLKLVDYAIPAIDKTLFARRVPVIGHKEDVVSGVWFIRRDDNDQTEASEWFNKDEEIGADILQQYLNNMQGNLPIVVLCIEAKAWRKAGNNVYEIAFKNNPVEKLRRFCDSALLKLAIKLEVATSSYNQTQEGAKQAEMMAKLKDELELVKSQTTNFKEELIAYVAKLEAANVDVYKNFRSVITGTTLGTPSDPETNPETDSDTSSGEEDEVEQEIELDRGQDADEEQPDKGQDLSRIDSLDKKQDEQANQVQVSNVQEREEQTGNSIEQVEDGGVIAKNEAPKRFSERTRIKTENVKEGKKPVKEGASEPSSKRKRDDAETVSKGQKVATNEAPEPPSKRKRDNEETVDAGKKPEKKRRRQ
ncbi:hypothetical protein LTR64_008412 [Lithohypha guttulata]|uniref:uncharacterized protein n=1 Tax=Lithohypha guttulata TaxID=1690604 RepID=UPI002DDDCE40|nr:hypothetical protein LTR51_008543 [Lithohypha guttulata]